MTTIIGVKLDNRSQTASEFQSVLTNYGCIIKTRLGIHEASENTCSANGLILLEVIDDAQAEVFEKELLKIKGLETKMMQFK